MISLVFIYVPGYIAIFHKDICFVRMNVMINYMELNFMFIFLLFFWFLMYYIGNVFWNR